MLSYISLLVVWERKLSRILNNMENGVAKTEDGDMLRTACDMLSTIMMSYFQSRCKAKKLSAAFYSFMCCKIEEFWKFAAKNEFSAIVFNRTRWREWFERFLIITFFCVKIWKNVFLEVFCVFKKRSSWTKILLMLITRNKKLFGK